MQDIQRLWDESVKRLGPIDIWVNNAGQNCPYEYCYETETSYVDSVIDTNLKGMIYGSQLAAKKMIEQDRGQIWNMEGLGSDGMIQPKTILYGTTKRALTYFTSALAKELKDTNVTVGRLSPGMMLTDFITKTPDGKRSPITDQKSFKKIFNILGDRPETVANYLVPKILGNTKNNRQIAWLTKSKILLRFFMSLLKKRKLI
jgi:short-subunit dehydrogenase